MTAPIIHICGWPGSGKATIGRALATHLNGRLIDNHLMLDPASALYGRDEPEHAALRAAVREAIFAAARDLPDHVALVMTDALADSDADKALFAPTQKLAHDRGADLLPITLEIDAVENRKRLTDPTRQARSKLMDPIVLAELRAKHRLLRPSGAITVDVTALKPNAAALAILKSLPTEMSA